MLLAGIGWLVWYYASREMEYVSDDVPDCDPLIGAQISPSQKATVKYFFVVTLLFLLQIIMGMLTAHYGVEGQGFYGIPLADYLPYVVEIVNNPCRQKLFERDLAEFWMDSFESKLFGRQLPAAKLLDIHIACMSELG